MTDLWQQQLEQTLRWHDLMLTELRSGIARDQKVAEAAALSLSSRMDQLTRYADDFKRRVEKLIGRRDDPIVYVRNYQETTLSVYHTTLQCGKVIDPDKMRGMLLGEAQEKRLRRCYSNLCARNDSQRTAA